MPSWPEFDEERLAASLARVDLHEGRYLAVREYHNVVNHLLRSASAACLLDREPLALELVARAGARMAEWIESAEQDRARQALYADVAATRGVLALALSPEDARRPVDAFLRQTSAAPAGPVQNARLAAAVLAGDAAGVQAAARACELSDAGLGLPWKRFALAVEAGDAEAATRAAQTWLREKVESTTTNEWGAYNDVPIEVSGALGLAEARGVRVRLDSNRVLTRFRA